MRTARSARADRVSLPHTLANLGLSVDPLTGNRYALAAGNPLSFIEWDGHLLVADGGGGGSQAGSGGAYDLFTAAREGGVNPPSSPVLGGLDAGFIRVERIREDDRGLLRRIGHGIMDFFTGYEATDHADYIAEVSERTGVDARTVMAIIRQESRLLQALPGTQMFETFIGGLDEAGIREGATVGIGQMQRATFVATAVKHPAVLGRRVSELEASAAWQGLISDGGLAIRATAYHLADLREALRLKVQENVSPFSDQELLALGYNAGEREMIDVARGQVPQSTSYIEAFRENFEWADDFFCHSEDWACYPDV